MTSKTRDGGNESKSQPQSVLSIALHASSRRRGLEIGTRKGTLAHRRQSCTPLTPVLQPSVFNRRDMSHPTSSERSRSAPVESMHALILTSCLPSTEPTSPPASCIPATRPSPCPADALDERRRRSTDHQSSRGSPRRASSKAKLLVGRHISGVGLRQAPDKLQTSAF